MRTILSGHFRLDVGGPSGVQVDQIGSPPRYQALLRPRLMVRQVTPVPPGRENLAARMIDHLRSGVPVEIYAPCGFGVSTLLRHVCARAGGELQVPAVYLPASQAYGMDDILRTLVWMLYAADQPIGLGTDECVDLLCHAQVVIALDEVSFEPQQVADLQCRRRHWRSYADRRTMPTLRTDVQVIDRAEGRKVGIVPAS